MTPVEQAREKLLDWSRDQNDSYAHVNSDFRRDVDALIDAVQADAQYRERLALDRCLELEARLLAVPSSSHLGDSNGKEAPVNSGAAHPRDAVDARTPNGETSRVEPRQAGDETASATQSVRERDRSKVVPSSSQQEIAAVTKEENDLGAHVCHGGRSDLEPAARPQLPHGTPSDVYVREWQQQVAIIGYPAALKWWKDGARQIAANLRSEGQTSRADHIDMLLYVLEPEHPATAASGRGIRTQQETASPVADTAHAGEE